MTGPGDTLVDVRILALPVAVYRETSEHMDGLLREFALITGQDTGGSRSVPGRLLELVEDISARYQGISSEQEAQLRAAAARSTDGHLDLSYRVPPGVAQACRDLDAMLDEADAYCRQGDELLTLAAPPSAIAFRKWFLGEFVRQLEGEAPTPWAEFVGRQSPPR